MGLMTPNKLLSSNEEINFEDIISLRFTERGEGHMLIKFRSIALVEAPIIVVYLRFRVVSINCDGDFLDIRWGS